MGAVLIDSCGAVAGRLHNSGAATNTVTMFVCHAGESKASKASKTASKSSHKSSSSRHTSTTWDPDPWDLIAKVSDFGLSVKMDPSHGHVSNLRQGTPFYIAPEVRDQGYMSMAADSFAFGALLFSVRGCFWSVVKELVG